MPFFYLCPFHWKLRPSGVILESPGLKDIAQVSANRAIVAQNHDARKAVSATLSVLKWSGTIFRPRRSKPSVRSFYLCPFYWKLRPLGVWLKSPGLKNNRQVLANRTKVAQNHDARKAVSSTLSVLKWSYAIFRPRNSTPSVRYFYLCPFHLKLRPYGVSIESPGLENIPQALANRAIVAQNHDARKAVSSTPSVFKWRGAIFRPESSTATFYLCRFY